MQLKEVARTLFAKIEGLDNQHQASLQVIMVQGDALIDGLYGCVQTLAPSLKDLLEPVIDELFVDLHVGLLIAMGAQFKASLLLLRTVLESSIYVIYFVDHPVEARLWADFNQDMSFADILECVCSPKYLHACTGNTVSEAQVKEIFRILSASYRELSERVHGKYRFLQILGNDETASLTTFVSLLARTFENIDRLLKLRMSTPAQAAHVSNS